MLTVAIFILVGTFFLPIFETGDNYIMLYDILKILEDISSISTKGYGILLFVFVLLMFEVVMLIGAVIGNKSMCLLSSAFGIGFLSPILFIGELLPISYGVLILWILFISAVILAICMPDNIKKKYIYYTKKTDTSPTYVPPKAILPTKLYCPKCYSSIEPGKFECSNCGTRLK